MPELVAGGPSIPVHLMNELDSGRVVFFCGAGISAHAGSGLPAFADLVDHVYEAHHIEADGVEREALDLDGRDDAGRQPNFDKALGLLERPDRLGAQALRRTVIERLSRPPAGPLDVHRALIALSRRERGTRLITTNFDNRFADAGLEEEFIDAAPKLPVPKPHNWSSLVHLHGRIVPDDDGSSLVLTAADFGRAYLTEQWAARFVTELFREFTVVFVGYSIGDPVMSYMVDALAAERTKGVRFTSAYAFADHDGSPDGERRARDGWLAKNVEPVLYGKRDDHRLLGDTLIQWARIRNDPVHARSRIAINEMSKMPSGADDPVVERVSWALQDPVAAKALADAPPIKDEANFAKIEKWLEVFAEKGLLRCAATEVNPDGGDQDPAFVRLVDSGYQFSNPQTVDRTRTHLARWVARHIHVPRVLAWALRAGGHMHPALRLEVERRLADPNSEIPSRLRLLWTVLSGSEPADPWESLWTSDRYAAADSETERLRIEEEGIKRLAPRLVVRSGPGRRLAFRQYFDGKAGSVSPINACGHLKLVSGDEDGRHRVKDVLENPEVLARYAERLTEYLDQALALGAEDDEIHEDSSFYRPSIAAHDQNREHDGWTHLIDLVRDSYSAVAQTDRACADNLLRRWGLSRHSLFKRLALHALAENAKADIQHARRLLVLGRKPGVWELDLRREVLRFFRRAGSRLPRSLRAELVRSIHAGPKGKRGKASPDYAQTVRREKALRLRKLLESGARLDKRSMALAEEVAPVAIGGPAERDEFVAWHGKGRRVSDEEFAPKELLDGSVAEVIAILERGETGRDAFRGFVLLQPVKAVSALRRLASRDRWPAAIWQGFFWTASALRERLKSEPRFQDYVARVLAAAPNELFATVGSAAGGFVKDLAENYGLDREQELQVLWNKAWTGIGQCEPEVLGLDDPLTDALNHLAGKLAEAALIRLWKHEPGVGTGLPALVRPYFNAISVDPNGQLGRVMLATRLYHLYAIDSDWVREHMIARLKPARSEEATALWSAYAWSPMVGPDLFQAFKEPFLEVLCDGPEGGQTEERLASLFMAICLEGPSELREDEIHRVIGSMSEAALITVLDSLKSRLTGGLDQRERVWREKVDPWLRKYWPAAAARNTSGTSVAMLDLLVACGNAFPDAAAWSLEYLRPLGGHGLHRLGENGQAQQHPDWMLQVLDRVVDADVLPVHQRHTLGQILDVLGVANEEMAANARFRRLHQIANR